MPGSAASASPVSYETAKQEYVAEINVLADVQRSINTGEWYIGGDIAPQDCNYRSSRPDTTKHCWDLMVGLDTWDGLAVSQVAPKVVTVLRDHGFTVRTWTLERGDITVQGNKKDGADLTVSLWPHTGGRPITIGYTTRCYPGNGDDVGNYLHDHGIIQNGPDYGLPGTYLWPDKTQVGSPEPQP
jgi:hypothetical protein